MQTLPVTPAAASPAAGTGSPTLDRVLGQVGCGVAGPVAGRFPTNVPFLDDFLGGGHAPGEVHGVLGAIGAGKSSLALRIAWEAARYQQAERLALADLPIVPVFWQRSFRLARLKGWKGLGMDAFGDPTLASLAPR